MFSIKKVQQSVLAIVALAAFVPAKSQAECVLTETVKLLASDDAAGDNFGDAVAVSGNFAVIGSPFDDDKGTNSGSAYVFRWNGTSWVQETKLLAADGQASDKFGSAVAIEGNLIVVGAPFEDGTGSARGAVYAFRYNGTSWVQEAKLVGSGVVNNGGFGITVVIDGSRLVVGQSGPSAITPLGTYGGRVTIFEFNGATWHEMTVISPQIGEYMGSGIDIDGNLLFLGSPGSTVGGQGSSGKAILMEYDGANWNRIGTLNPAVADPNGLFGASISISGDRILCGAPDDAGGPGAAYVFRHEGANWVEEADLSASDLVAGDQFGTSLTLDGDLAVIGGLKSKAYVFSRNGTSWVEIGKLTASDAVSTDKFGTCVSFSGGRAIVGAPFNDDGGSNSGSAYLYQPIANCNGNGAMDRCDITSGTSLDTNGNLVPDECDIPADADSDGIPDGSDNCPSTPNPDQANLDGDGLGDACDGDVDGDGVPNGSDNCPLLANANQSDVDSDGIGDLCDPDSDNDGVPNAIDNCPLAVNPDQANLDGDALGDVCDSDLDGDGVPNASDNCPNLANADQTDADSDGIGDACDPSVDSDGDGIDNVTDNCPFVANADQADFDGDGIGDECDADEDGDGVPNDDDVCPMTKLGRRVDCQGRPRLDMNDDCEVNGLDIQPITNDILGM